MTVHHCVPKADLEKVLNPSGSTNCELRFFCECKTPNSSDQYFNRGVLSCRWIVIFGLIFSFLKSSQFCTSEEGNFPVFQYVFCEQRNVFHRRKLLKLTFLQIGNGLYIKIKNISFQNELIFISFCRRNCFCILKNINCTN